MTFSKFIELPPELRQMVWKAALPSSRVVLLEHKERHFDDEISKFIPRIDRIGFRSDTPAPSILLACKEANKVACQYYSKAFTNKTGTSIPETYFDFANDFLYLGPEWVGPRQPLNQERILYVLANELHTSDLSRVENLAIWWDCNNRGGYRRADLYLSEVLKHFENVNHIALVSKIYRGRRYVDHVEENAELKLVDGTALYQADIEIHGNPLPGSSKWVPTADVDLELLRFVTSTRQDSQKAKKALSIEYNMIVTPEGEEHLLELAKDADFGLRWELEWISQGISGYFRRKIVPSSKSLPFN
ncbi:hypothetical protein N431DRAFT_163753 [Stipitochalara longipes BDJ]|nr:hypothetical protein N431DRAFT_163753 [Stipitochalara longipes BDJ]